MNYFRRGLTDTGIWPLLTHRRDVIPVLFPRESDAQVTPQVPRTNVHKISPKKRLLYVKANWKSGIDHKEIIQFQMILDCVVWPSSITVIFEKYEAEYLGRDDSCAPDIKRVCGFLKTFIENGTYGSCCCCCL